MRRSPASGVSNREVGLAVSAQWTAVGLVEARYINLKTGKRCWDSLESLVGRPGELACRRGGARLMVKPTPGDISPAKRSGYVSPHPGVQTPIADPQCASRNRMGVPTRYLI
ncbi:MAG: hypothetical protein KatS3mg077_1236 [Candidatus Binatia bacterium]|nr:MAG: hypothetical protein KatS3mg077_1236 [Candidatus Binatia bacterium]